MATFVLIPGAGGHAAYWALLVPELQQRGHEAVAVDIAEDDPALGLPEYAQIVERAIGDRQEVPLVAQSLAGFTDPMVAKPVSMIVLLNAMIPLPGETPGQWFDTTAAGQFRRAADQAAGRSGEFDVETHFLHDLSSQARAVLVAAGPPRAITRGPKPVLRAREYPPLWSSTRPPARPVPAPSHQPARLPGITR